MLKKIFAFLLLFVWIYILLVFLKPWFTDYFEEKIWVNFSKQLRWLKQVADWKKTFKEFKEKYIDSVRKDVIETKNSIDKNIDIVKKSIKKVEETKEKIEKISKILKDEDTQTNNLVQKKSNSWSEQLDEKIREKLEKSILEKAKEKKLTPKKIDYDVMWDINDF